MLPRTRRTLNPATAHWIRRKVFTRAHVNGASGPNRMRPQAAWSPTEAFCLDALDARPRAAGRVRDTDPERDPDAGGVVVVVLLEEDPVRIDRLADEVPGLEPAHEVGDVEILAEQHFV